MHHSIINNNKQVQVSCYMSPKQISLLIYLISHINELGDTKVDSMFSFDFDFYDYDIGNYH